MSWSRSIAWRSNVPRQCLLVPTIRQANAVASVLKVAPPAPVWRDGLLQTDPRGPRLRNVSFSSSRDLRLEIGEELLTSARCRVQSSNPSRTSVANQPQQQLLDSDQVAWRILESRGDSVMPCRQNEKSAQWTSRIRWRRAFGALRVELVWMVLRRNRRRREDRPPVQPGSATTSTSSCRGTAAPARIATSASTSIAAQASSASTASSVLTTPASRLSPPSAFVM